MIGCLILLTLLWCRNYENRSLETITKKDLPKSKGIDQVLGEKIFHHVIETGDYPKAMILDPNEYVELCTSLSFRIMGGYYSHHSETMHYDGVRIEVFINKDGVILPPKKFAQFLIDEVRN